MTQLMDNLTKESVQRLHEAFVEGVLEIERTDSGDLLLNSRNFQKVGPPIVEYVHTRLMQASRPNNTGKLLDFPRVTDIGIGSILNEEGVTHLKNQKKGIYRSVGVGNDVSRILQHAGIGQYVRPLWYLKPYDASRVEWVAISEGTARVDPRAEKRMVEEAAKTEANTRTRIDLRSIKRPDEFTPEQVRDFIERFVPSALKLQERYEKLQEVHAGMLAEIEEKASEDQWAELADVIEGVFK